MRKLSLAALCCVLPLLAEDFWKSKPYTEWTEKEMKRIMTNSPWAKEVAAVMPGGGGTGGGGGGRGGRSRGVGGGGADSIEGGGGVIDGGGGMGGRGGMGGGGGEMGGGGGAPAVMAKLRWQTALPVKQALVKMKYGAEAETSAQAQQVLTADEPMYLLVLEGLPERLAAMGGARLQENLKKTSMLRRGDRDPILPAQIKVGMSNRTVLIYFGFPKTDAITLEDKDVEFVSKVGPMEFKKKFKLSDMVINGKLTL